MIQESNSLVWIDSNLVPVGHDVLFDHGGPVADLPHEAVDLVIVEEDGEADVQSRPDDDEDRQDKLFPDPASHEAVEDDVHDLVDGCRTVPDDGPRQVNVSWFGSKEQF